MKNVSKVFVGVFGLAAGFIIGTVWNDLENRHNHVEPIKCQKYCSAVNEIAKTRDVLFDRINDAYYILGQMNTIIVEYGFVSVADFFDLVGVTPDFIDSKYGWYNMNAAYVDLESGAYALRLPVPVALNN